MSEREVTPEWPTKNEVAKKLGKSLAGITRLTRAGKLNPVDFEGQNRYDPKEVQECLNDPDINTHASDKRREEFAEIQLSVVRDMISLVKDPRDKIDTLQFQIIADLRTENKELRDKYNKALDDIEAARDKSSEREAALALLKSDQAIKQTAMTRIMTTIGTLINGPEGVKLSPEQLEQLLIANEEEKFFTPEQEKLAKQTVAQHKAKTNGKETVASVAKTVVDATGETK